MEQEKTEGQRAMEHAAFELKYWQEHRDASHFTAMLFELIAKADMRNRRRLASGFPIEVHIYEEWYNCTTAGEFYAKYGLMK